MTHPVFFMKMMCIAVSIVLLTALSSCGNQKDSAPEPTARLEIEQRVNPSKPVYRFVFEYFGDSGEDYCPALCILTVYNKEDGKQMQEFAFEGVCFNKEIQVMLADLNFDGYCDLIAETGHGAHANAGSFNLFCWQENATTGLEGFISEPSLEYSAASPESIEVFENTHQFIAHGDGISCMYQVERADEYSMPEFRMLRYYSFDWMTDETVRFYERGKIHNELIYEYPASYENQEETESLLRFGILNPISPEEAIKIAAREHPEAELALKQMLTFGGASYYHIHLSGSENAGECGVSVDGKQMVDCASYLTELEARAFPAFNRNGDIV